MTEERQVGLGLEDEEQTDKKRTRKEVMQEVMEKSKAYDYIKKEIKLQNIEMTKELNEDFNNLLSSVKYAHTQEKNSNDQTKLKKAKKDPKPEELSYDELMQQFRIEKKAQPLKATELTEKEKALARKKKLLQL